MFDSCKERTGKTARKSSKTLLKLSVNPHSVLNAPMLVCPHCQSENPNNHRFCQKCGVSLVDQPCPNCETRVAFSAATCPNCGVATGVRWRIIIAEPYSESSSEDSAVKTREYGKYIDVGQRYLLLTSEGEPEFLELGQQGDYLVWQGTVIDSQPLQKSVLEVFLKQAQEQYEKETEEDSPSQTYLWQNLGIPNLALPYLALSEDISLLPPIHDAWQVENQEFILLGDRSDWQSLAQLMAEEPLPLLPILYWFKEMLKLWNKLAPFKACQSLLVESNLGLDEDQSVILGVIYPDKADEPPNIQELATLWQKWLTSSLQCPSDSFNTLLEEITKGNLSQIEEIEMKVDDLIEEQQKIDRNEDLPGEALDIEDLPEILREQLAEAEKAHPIRQNPELDDSLITSGPQVMFTEIGDGDDQPTAVLPMKLLNLSDAGLSDTGRQRRHNEDFFSIVTQINLTHHNKVREVQAKGLYIVCDGMGGHASGEVASAMAVETLTDYFQTHWEDNLPSQEVVLEGIHLANQALYDVNQENASSGSGRMGTTLVLALLQNTNVVIAHVGDSRIYRVNRKWGLEQLTVDHEVGQRAIQSGIEPEIAYARPDAYQLTQALGPHDNHFIKPDIRYLHIQEDTLLLLCSDGLSDNHLIEDHWESHLLPLISAGQNLDMGLQKLITLGNQKNGHDNITAILIRIKVRPDLESEDW
jgi:protein phosphatase